ncbi:MAG TPA: hypothetical protein VF158_02790 [Longimicrobiales bacterium]
MTVDPALHRRLQERSDRLERQARILGDAFHRFAEELAGLGRDLAQLETPIGQPAPDATPPSPQPRRPRARPAVETRTCAVCGEEFTRNAGERLNNFRRRRTCGRSECMRESISRNRAGKAATRRPVAPEQPAEPAEASVEAEAPAAQLEEPEPAVEPDPTPPEPEPEPAPQAEAAPHRFAWEPPARHEPIRLQPLGEPCPNHPGETIGAYGCPACRAGENWRKRGQVAKVTIGSRP